MVAISPNPSTFADAKIQLKTENGKRKTENFQKNYYLCEKVARFFARHRASGVRKFGLTYYIIIVAGALSALALSSCGTVNRQQKQSDETIVKEQPQRLRLLFTGDAMCHTPQIASARCQDHSIDFRPSFEGVKRHFDRADIAVVNFETTISTSSQYTGYPCFASPAEYADALAWLGTDVALLANNHCCDKGRSGIHATIAKLDSLGIAHTGAFLNEEDRQRNSILRFERNGIKLSLLNYTYGTNGNPIPKGCYVNLIDTLKMAQDIALASEGADCVVACMPWGYEYQQKPAYIQRKLAQFLHRHGVGIVVGTHPHTVQPYTATERQITIYSLGNFVSNQRKGFTDGGLLAEIEIERGADSICRYALRMVPIWVKVPGHNIISSEFASEVEFTESQQADYKRFINNTDSLLNRGVKH